MLLSARRVGPSGFVYGVDMTEEMLTLARANAARAGAENVEFVKGEIEALPLPDQTVDVVISNCVINLSTDKPAVLAEMFRVLVPGGRIGITDVVAEDHLSAADRTAAGSYVGCIAGALSRTEYLAGLAAAGFADASVTFTHEAAPDMHSAIIRGSSPPPGSWLMAADCWQTSAATVAGDPAREALLRRGFVLEYVTLSWNVVGIVVLALAAVSARSVALAGFGLDSLIEIGASTVVIWELSGRARSASAAACG